MLVIAWGQEVFQYSQTSERFLNYSQKDKINNMTVWNKFKDDL